MTLEYAFIDKWCKFRNLLCDFHCKCEGIPLDLSSYCFEDALQIYMLPLNKSEAAALKKVIQIRKDIDNGHKKEILPSMIDTLDEHIATLEKEIREFK